MVVDYQTTPEGRANKTRMGTTTQDKRAISLFLSLIHAGFPSPADDYVDNVLDLNELVIKHPAATFFVRVTGDSMINAYICEDDIIVVDTVDQAMDALKKHHQHHQPRALAAH